MTDRDEEIVYVREGDSALKWLLVGGVLGAGLALLFAPQSGEETRRAIRRRAEELRDQAEEKWDEAGERLSEERERMREAVHDRVEDARERVSDVRERAAEVVDAVRGAGGTAREELERRLTSARQRRRTARVPDDEGDDEESLA